MISLLESQSAIHESSSILPKNWGCKRKRSSSSSSRAMTCSSLLVLPLSSPEPITTIAPPLPSKLRVSRRFRECTVVRKPETKPRPITVVKASESDDDDGSKPSQQNPTKKTVKYTRSRPEHLEPNHPSPRADRLLVHFSRREELSENLSKVSQQRLAVAEGAEDAMRLYECIKAYELQLAGKEKELKLCLEQELEACEKLAIIDDHWLALSLQPLQHYRFLSPY